MSTTILAVGGSPRRGANSDALAGRILAGAEAEGAQTEFVALRNYHFSSCVGCEQCRKDKACTRLLDGMQLIYPKVEAAQGLVLVSPVHNYNVTALMKAFIDRLYCYYDFTDDHPRDYSSRLAGRGAAAAVAAVAEQVDPHDMGPTLEMLAKPLEPHGYRIVGSLPVLGMFQAGKVKGAPDVMQQAEDLGRELARSLAG